MKNLLIMRHAKSSWKEDGLVDHDRPLNPRGNRDAPRMGMWLADQKLVPDLVLSSTANRAVSTARLVVENCLGIECEVQTTDDLYHAPARVYIETAKRFPDQVNIALVVGHNPGMEDLVTNLAGDYEAMPTATIAWFTFNIDRWEDLDINQAQRKEIWRPKEIF